MFFSPRLQRATLAEKEVTALKEQLTNNKSQDTNVMTMATPLSNHVESTEDQNKTPAELELSAKEKEVSIFFFSATQYAYRYALVSQIHDSAVPICLCEECTINYE
jgi:hypothetical protein